jgi:hypothetical protein
MDANSRKKPSQLEINDLIAEAVVNAEARRNQAVELLSDEELAAVKGGYTSLGMTGNSGTTTTTGMKDTYQPTAAEIKEVRPFKGFSSLNLNEILL